MLTKWGKTIFCINFETFALFVYFRLKKKATKSVIVFRLLSFMLFGLKSRILFCGSFISLSPMLKEPQLAVNVNLKYPKFPLKKSGWY